MSKFKCRMNDEARRTNLRILPFGLHSSFDFRHSTLGVKHRLAQVELQDLSLHLDRANEHPDLVGCELAGVAAGQRLELFGHRGVLIGRRLQPERGFAPRGSEQRVVIQLADIVADVRQKQTQAGDVARAGVGLEPLNSVSELLASHNKSARARCAGRRMTSSRADESRPHQAIASATLALKCKTGEQFARFQRRRRQKATMATKSSGFVDGKTERFSPNVGPVGRQG